MYKRKIGVEVLKLISTIKKHDCLWNPENINYKRGFMTVRAWMDVAEKMGMKDTILRAKWKNLKDAYRKELKKNYIDGEYKGIWQYFEELDFLRNFIIKDVTEDVTERVDEESVSDDEIDKEEQRRSTAAIKSKADYIDSGLKLISEIQKHECLWKKRRCPNAMRACAWNEISEKLGISIPQLVKKWKNLKYAYKKEILNNCVNGEYQGIWPYFEALDFLRNYVTLNLERVEEETFSDDEINEELQEIIRTGQAYKRKTDYSCIKLIAEIKKHECLYQKSRSLNTARYRAWREISEKLDKPIPKLRQKWRNLTYTYKKEVLNNYIDGEYKGTWQYFNMLNFVKVDVYEINDKNDEALSDGEQSDPEMDEAQFEYEIENQIKVEVEADNLQYLNETYLEEDSIAKKRPRLEDDEYDLMFLKSLGPFFRGLDPVRKLVLRSKIQDMVMNELALSS